LKGTLQPIDLGVELRHAVFYPSVHARHRMAASRRRGRRALSRTASFSMSTPNTRVTDNGTIKDPAEWTTGDEPITGAQDSYLHTLARKSGEEVGADLTKAEASITIDELREKTGVDSVPAKAQRKPADRARRGRRWTDCVRNCAR